MKAWPLLRLLIRTNQDAPLPDFPGAMPQEIVQNYVVLSCTLSVSLSEEDM